MIQKMKSSNPVMLYGGGAAGIALIGGVAYVAFQVLSIVLTGVMYLLLALPVIVFVVMWPTIAYTLSLARRKIEEAATRSAPIQALEVALIARKRRLGEIKEQYSKVNGLFNANRVRITKLMLKVEEPERAQYREMIENQGEAVAKLLTVVQNAERALNAFEDKIELERARAEIAQGNMEIARLLNIDNINPGEKINVETAFNQIDRMFGEADSALRMMGVAA